MAHETNKWQVRHELESHGWWVAYGEEIGTDEYFAFAAAFAASVATENPGPVLAYIQELVTTSIQTLATNAASEFSTQILNLSKQLIANAIDDALRTGRVTNIALEGIDLQIGLAKYWRREVVDLPDFISNPINDVADAATNIGQQVGDAISSIFRSGKGQSRGLVEVPGTRHPSYQPYIRLRIRIGDGENITLPPLVVITIYNELSFEFNLAFSWLIGEQWQGGNYSIPANQYRWWWAQGARASQISFDWLPQPGLQVKTYALDFNVIYGRPASPADGRKYLVSGSENSWDVFAALRDTRSVWDGAWSRVKNIGGTNWQEHVKSTGEFIAGFTETYRDRDFVYAYDSGRNVSIALGESLAYWRIGQEGAWNFGQNGHWAGVYDEDVDL